MGAALAEQDAADRRITAKARLAAAPEYLELLLKTAFSASRRRIVLYRTALRLDARLQYLTQSMMKTDNFFEGKGAARPPWIYAGVKQRFVGVDIANTRHYCLVEQQRLDVCFAPVQGFRQGLGKKLCAQRLRTQLSHNL